MAIPSPTARLARLNDACARIRGAASITADDVLDVAAEEIRVLAGARHAWAARIDNGTLGAPRTTIDDSNPASNDPPPPALASLLALTRTNAGAAGGTARSEGFLVVAALGSNGAEGVVAVSGMLRAATTEDAELDLELVQIAAVAGLALEAARLRARVELVGRAREALLASVSHDLRNPLNTFAMSAGLLRDDLERDDVDTTRGLSLIARMERATTRMQGLIEDLVEASRIDARKIDYAIREESAAQLVRDAVTAATPKPSEKSAAVFADSLDDDAHVMADRGRTLQLLAKVVAFEAKSTGDSGSIRLGVSRQPEGVVFTARAIGPGGAPVSAPEEGRGGLALLIARGLVEAQRGTFRVEGGDGLAVSFTLPAAKS
jgi:K+-sensing histidine kinase KdpD